MKRFLGVFQTYDYSNLYHLPGVTADYVNLRALAKRLGRSGLWSAHLLYNSDYASIASALADENLELLWFCGHGVLTPDGRNIYLIDDMTTNLNDRVMYELLAKDTLTLHALYIFDFCHSCTMLNLRYYYKNGTFYKKVLDAEVGMFDDNPIMTRVCIAGSSDFGTTNEDVRGGKLTQYILYLLYTFGYLSLRLFDTNLTTAVGRSVVSTNKIIDEDEPLLSLPLPAMQQ